MSRRALPLLVLLVPASALAWGFNGHRRLAANAHQPFPQGSCLRGWLAQVTGQSSWQDHATDPDTWRDSDPAEAPRHYLNIDYADPIDSYPRDWAEVQAKFGQYAVKNGQVPFRVESVYGDLVNQMKAGDSDGARLTVAWLAHYVCDAFSPMHDTKNQPGDLHLRYESDMLAVSSQINAITDDMRQYFGTLGRAAPKDVIFDAVIVGNPVALKVIDDDFRSGGDMAALYANTEDLTARRWGDSLTVLASLIGSAWVDAGKPMLQGMPSGCDAEVAQGALVLKGFPLPPPEEAPDAGAGAEDAGEDAGPGQPPDSGPQADAGSPEGGVDPSSCPGCGGAPAAIAPMLVFAFLLPLRRRR